MKLFDKIFYKLGYVKAEKYNELRLQYNLMQKYDIQLLRMNYEISDFMLTRMTPEQIAGVEEHKLKEFIKIVAPFIEKRIHSPVKFTGRHIELRLYVGKPKSDNHEVFTQS